MKLIIISHTEHYKQPDGTVVGWGPTISELNHLIDEFDEITHIAMLHLEAPPSSSLPYNSSKIKFVPLPVLGGKSILSKLKLIYYAPKIIQIVKNELKESDVFQLRTPTGIGVFLIPLMTFFVKTRGWYKYAGNWKQKNPPLGYRIQRWMLKKQKRPVTINGKWKNQPKHCFTFENPCLTNDDVNKGLKIVSEKEFRKPYSFCFVGRLEKEKGVERIINAFSALSKEEKRYIAQVHFVGDGNNTIFYKKLAINSGIEMIFHGFLSRNDVFNLYKNSHFFLLPTTASEGFPKVIAEAMNFGCIPIVADVSSICQYINNTNGYIVLPTTTEKLKEIISTILGEDEKDLQEKAKFGTRESFKFTFDNYNKRIKEEILNSI